MWFFCLHESDLLVLCLIVSVRCQITTKSAELLETMNVFNVVNLFVTIHQGDQKSGLN